MFLSVLLIFLTICVGLYIYIGDTKPPLIKVSGNLHYKRGEDYSKVQHVNGTIYCEGETSLNFPELISVNGYIYADNAIKINAPKLRVVQNGFKAPKLNKASFPSLENVYGCIGWNDAAEIDVPKLKQLMCRTSWDSCLLLNAPELTYMEGVLWITKIPYLNLPKLYSWRGVIRADFCEKVDFLEARGKSNLIVNSETQVNTPKAKRVLFNKK